MYQVKTTGVFEKNVKKLSKKYRHIKKDFSPVLEKLESGQLVGDPVAGFQNRIFKARVPSSDQKKGKSGGFRLIYYFILEGKTIFLLSMYAKAKQSNIKKSEIQRILDSL